MTSLSGTTVHQTAARLRWRAPDEFDQIAKNLAADGLGETAAAYRLAADQMRARAPFLRRLVKRSNPEKYPTMSITAVYQHGCDIVALLKDEGWIVPRVLLEPAIEKAADA